MQATDDHDPIFEAIAEYKRAERRANALSERVDAAEDEAKLTIGPKPWRGINWRGYAGIGGSEIEGARDTFLARGLSPKLVESEYLDAKERERAAEREWRDWYVRAGMSDLVREKADADAAEHRALMLVARTKPLTPAGAAAFLSFIREDMKHGNSDWHDVALATLASSLNGWADAVAA